ncbi:MAG: DUF2807 domain-containing protein [Reichenbachiella sp.]
MMNYKLYSIGLLVSFSTVFMSCEDKINPSSTITTQETVIGGYTGIDVLNAFDVEVFYSDEEYIVIQTNENLHDYIEVYNEDGVLHLKVDNGVNISGNSTFKARLYTKNLLKRVEVSGASKVNIVDALFDEEVVFDISEASFVQAELAVRSITAKLDGASNFHVDGVVAEVFMNLSGASRMTDGTLESNMATMELSGASSCELIINNELSLEATGASVLRYSGDAIIKEISLSGSSTIEKV